MRVNFRQGIINYQLPSFLQINRTSIDLVVNNTPLLFTIASGSKDYLFVENNYISKAWPNLISNTDQWIYIDYNTRTAVRTFGITRFSPVVSASAPNNPIVDQHWFDTNTNQMKVWSGTIWTPKIRIIVAKIQKGLIPISVSENSPNFSGTQIGNNTPILAGTILFNNETGAPLIDNSGHFITTEDHLRTENTHTSLLKFANTLIEAAADQNMAAFTFVTFSDFRHIVHANSYTASRDAPYGMILEDVNIGDTTNVIVDGIVSNSNWDWTAAGINAPLYCDDAGTLSTVPTIPHQVYSALVIDTKTILLGPPRQINTGSGSSTNVAPMTTTQLGIARLSVPAVSITDPIVVGSNDPRIADVVQQSGGIMTGPLVLHGNPVNSLDAVPKQYVDNLHIPTTLESLSNTNIINPSAGQFLSYNGVDWINVNNSATTSLPDIIVPGTAAKVSYNAKGLITSTSTLIASDIPNIPWSKINTTPTTLAGYGITDVYTKTLSDNRYLQTSLTLNFTGDFTASGPIGGTITTTLVNSGVTAGTYTSVNVNSKGLVISGTNPTTLVGYGITDAQPLNTELTAIANIVATSGLIRKTAAGIYSLDTSSYLTANQSINITGDASGSGTTNINLVLNTVPINKGGTGQTTAQGAINALLPTQTANTNKALVTDGTNVSWQDVTIHPATTTAIGGVIVGSGLSVDQIGTISTIPYTLPTASASTLGGIKVGSGLAIDGAGVLSTNSIIETMSSGNFAVPGDCIGRELVIYGISTSAAPIDLLLSGTTRLVLADNSSWGYEITVIGTRTDASGYGMWKYSGNIIRGVGAASTMIVPNQLQVVVSVTDPNWTVIVQADTTNGALQVKGGGVVNSTIRWAASVKTIEIKY